MTTMTVIIIKDNGDTETVALTIEQAEKICSHLIGNGDTGLILSNFGAFFQPHSYYKSESTGTTRKL